MTGCIFHMEYEQGCMFCRMIKHPRSKETISERNRMETALKRKPLPKTIVLGDKKPNSIETQAIFVMESHQRIVEVLNHGLPDDWFNHCAYPTYFVCDFDGSGEPFNQKFVPTGMFHAGYVVIGCQGAMMVVEEKNDR